MSDADSERGHTFHLDDYGDAGAWCSCMQWEYPLVEIMNASAEEVEQAWKDHVYGATSKETDRE